MTNETNNYPKIYGAIAQAIGDVGLIGFGKDGRNSSQGFDYRSIDGVRNGLNAVLAKNGLVITAKVDQIERSVEGRNITITNEHIFTIYAIDGSSIEYRLFLTNLGKDPSKLAGSSASYAFKTMAIDVFCMPTTGSDDLDNRDENDLKVSFMPKIERNSKGVVWTDADPSQGAASFLDWGTMMTGVEGKEIMDRTDPDENGKKARNFAAKVRRMWSGE